MNKTNTTDFNFPSPVWRIGFSGHRELDDESLLSEAFDAALKEAAEKVDGQIECLLSLAKGADILMAESCRRKNVPYHVLLPLEEPLFHEEITPDWKDRFDVAREHAISVESLSGSRSRGAAYYKCGIDILNASDIMLFCWDGEQERGLGGTAQIVEAAKLKKMPKGWIHAQSGDLTWENLDNRLTDLTASEVMKFTSLSIDTTGQLDKKATISKILNAVDQEASNAAPKHRFLSVSNLSIHAVATIIATIGLGFAFPGYGIAKVFLLLIALGVFYFAQRQKLHERWFILRGLGEVIRSLQASGTFLPRSAVNQLWGNFYQFGLITRPLYNLIHNKANPEENWEQNREEYIRNRIDEQIKYYNESANALRPQQTWLNGFFWIFLGSAIVAAAVYAGEHSFGHSDSHPEDLEHASANHNLESDHTKDDWLGKSTIILPILSMLMISIKSSLDIDRRLSRFNQMKMALKQSREEISIPIVPSLFYESVVRIESRLLQEVSEWYQNVRHLHIH